MAGLAAAFGSGAATNTISDLENTHVILLTGSNITENHPVIGAALKRAVKSGKTKLMVIDPRSIEISRYAALVLHPAPGTDTAWLNGMAHIILRHKLYDENFIKTRTEAFHELKTAVAEYTPEYVENITGIQAEKIIQAAHLYASGPAALLYCMGITQHTSGTDNVKALANLAMLCGNIGKKGTGLIPLRGQNNVQGSCDMGALPHTLPGYVSIHNENACKNMARAWHVSHLPQRPGLTAAAMFEGAGKRQVAGMYIIGENSLVSHPNLHHAAKCLNALDFLVVQDIFLTETAQKADVVLPAACFAEKDGTFTNTERRIQRVRKAVSPPGAAKADWEIICLVAQAMGHPMHYGQPQEIMADIARDLPAYGGITWHRVESQALHWPCPDKDHPGTPVLHKENFVRGKGKFHVVQFRPPAEMPDEKYPFTLITGRNLYHYHTGTMTRKSKALHEKLPKNYLEMAGEDAKNLGLTTKEQVRVISQRGEITVEVHITSRVKPGTVFLPFHFAEAAANILTNDAKDPACDIAEVKVCAVDISPVNQP